MAPGHAGVQKQPNGAARFLAPVSQLDNAHLDVIMMRRISMQFISVLLQSDDSCMSYSYLLAMIAWLSMWFESLLAPGPRRF